MDPVWPAPYWWPVLLENWAALPWIAHGLLVLSHLGSGHRPWVSVQKGLPFCSELSTTRIPTKVWFGGAAHCLSWAASLLCWSSPGCSEIWGQTCSTTQTIPGLCVLPQKSLIPLVTPVNLFPQQTCTGTCSCPKETCGRTSVSERLSNSVHNCRDMSIISNSLQKRKAFLLSIRPCGNRNWPSCANLVGVIDSSFHTDFQAKVISKS